MIYTLRKILIAGFMIFASASVFGQVPDTDRILAEIDELRNFDDTDFSCVYTIVSEKPGEERSVTEALMFRRDTNDEFVMLIRKPDVQRGQGYLMIDDNVWFYDPDSREFEHSSLSENITDSEAKNSDFNRNSLSDDYSVESWETGELGGKAVYILNLKAKTTDVSYDRMKIWVRQDVTIVLKSEEYGFSGNLMRTTGYFNYVKLGDDKYIPTQMLLVDHLNVGEKTQVTLKNPSLKKIPDDVFSKSYLERVNQ